MIVLVEWRYPCGVGGRARAGGVYRSGVCAMCEHMFALPCRLQILARAWPAQHARARRAKQERDVGKQLLDRAPETRSCLCTTTIPVLVSGGFGGPGSRVLDYWGKERCRKCSSGADRRAVGLSLGFWGCAVGRIMWRTDHTDPRGFACRAGVPWVMHGCAEMFALRLLCCNLMGKMNAWCF
jgi:hypothetical protein